MNIIRSRSSEEDIASFLRSQKFGKFCYLLVEVFAAMQLYRESTKTGNAVHFTKLTGHLKMLFLHFFLHCSFVECIFACILCSRTKSIIICSDAQTKPSTQCGALNTFIFHLFANEKQCSLNKLILALNCDCFNHVAGGII